MVPHTLANTSTRSIDEVDDVVTSYKQSHIIALWLTLKKKKGESLPKNKSELMEFKFHDIRIKTIVAKV